MLTVQSTRDHIPTDNGYPPASSQQIRKLQNKPFPAKTASAAAKSDKKLKKRLSDPLKVLEQAQRGGLVSRLWAPTIFYTRTSSRGLLWLLLAYNKIS